MRQAMTNKFTQYLTALLFSVILTACGGGSDNIEYGNNTQTGTGNTGGTGGGNNPLPQGDRSILLSWDAPLYYTDGSVLNVQGHKIYMKAGNGNFVLVGTLTGTFTLTHTVNNLSTGTTYTFAVTAFDNQGAESSFSNTVIVTL